MIFSSEIMFEGYLSHFLVLICLNLKESFSVSAPSGTFTELSYDYSSISKFDSTQYWILIKDKYSLLI